jgi:hypothetical protein
MTAAIETKGLGKQYRRTWALADLGTDPPRGSPAGDASRARSRAARPAGRGGRAGAGDDHGHYLTGTTSPSTGRGGTSPCGQAPAAGGASRRPAVRLHRRHGHASHPGRTRPVS